MGTKAPLNLELPVVDQGVSKPISMFSSAEENGENGGRPWTVVVRDSTSISRYPTGMNLHNIFVLNENEHRELTGEPAANKQSPSAHRTLIKDIDGLIHLQLSQSCGACTVLDTRCNVMQHSSDTSHLSS
jgi:hypothetical protein